MRIALYAILSNIAIIGLFYWLDHPYNLPYKKALSEKQHEVISHIPRPKKDK